MEFQRLNMDSSWALHWHGQTGLVDPWLVGSEIDGFRWLNEQWHSTPPISPDQLPKADFLLISQSYSDHCHFETLEQLAADWPIFATPKAFRRLRQKFPDRPLRPVPNFTEPALESGPLRFWHFHPGNRMDPVYFGVLIVDADNTGVFYSPHGFALHPDQKAFIRQFDIQLLITTFTDFELPSIMGGRVNPGLPNVTQLMEDLRPQYVLNTHDEAKKMKGLVQRLAKVQYPDWPQVELLFGDRFLASPDYRPMQIPPRQED